MNQLFQLKSSIANIISGTKEAPESFLHWVPIEFWLSSSADRVPTGYRLHLLRNLLQLLFSTFTASSTIFFIFLSIFIITWKCQTWKEFLLSRLVEVCIFLIIFIFTILSMFVCIMYFCRIYKKRKRKRKKGRRI